MIDNDGGDRPSMKRVMFENDEGIERGLDVAILGEEFRIAFRTSGRCLGRWGLHGGRAIDETGAGIGGGKTCPPIYCCATAILPCDMFTLTKS